MLGGKQRSVALGKRIRSPMYIYKIKGMKLYQISKSSYKMQGISIIFSIYKYAANLHTNPTLGLGIQKRHSLNQTQCLCLTQSKYAGMY